MLLLVEALAVLVGWFRVRPVHPSAGVLLAGGAGLGVAVGALGLAGELAGIAAFVSGRATGPGGARESAVFLVLALAFLGPPLAHATAIATAALSVGLLAGRIRGTPLDDRADRADGASP